MKTLSELINTSDPGITIVNQWIKEAIRPVEILPLQNRLLAEESLLHSQVTTRSTLGAIIYETGGLVIEHGWLKIFGGGHESLPSIYQWNEHKTISKATSPYYIVATDILGGYFCINGGGLGNDLGNIYYFAPDNLAFEALDVGHTDLIYFFLCGDTDSFYRDLRWPTWKEDIASLPLDQAISLVPPLWTKEGKNISASIKQPIQMEELYNVHKEFRDGLNAIEDKYI